VVAATHTGFTAGWRHSPRGLGRIVSGRDPDGMDMDPRTYYWNLIVVGPLEGILGFLAHNLGLGAGLAIILFTVALRLALLPLTLRQRRSQQAMARLQPQLATLRRKHGEDRRRLQTETAALYERHGVGPGSGIVPTLLQLPILFGVYAALRDLNAHDLAFSAPWLWLTSLNHPDVFHLGVLTLPGPLPLLVAGAQWLHQRWATVPPVAAESRDGASSPGRGGVAGQ
jgi:YidC/Oxa1 family membrane protein insertase